MTKKLRKELAAERKALAPFRGFDPTHEAAAIINAVKFDRAAAATLEKKCLAAFAVGVPASREAADDLAAAIARSV